MIESTAPSSDETIAILRTMLPTARFDQVMGWITQPANTAQSQGAKVKNKAEWDKYQTAITQALEAFSPPYNCHLVHDLCIQMDKYDSSHWGLLDNPTEATIRKHLKTILPK